MHQAVQEGMFGIIWMYRGGGKVERLSEPRVYVPAQAKRNVRSNCWHDDLVVGVLQDYACWTVYLHCPTLLL